MRDTHDAAHSHTGSTYRPAGPTTRCPCRTEGAGSRGHRSRRRAKCRAGVVAHAKQAGFVVRRQSLARTLPGCAPWLVAHRLPVGGVAKRAACSVFCIPPAAHIACRSSERQRKRGGLTFSTGMLRSMTGSSMAAAPPHSLLSPKPESTNYFPAKTLSRRLKLKKLKIDDRPRPGRA